MNASRHGIAATAIAFLFLGASSVALAGNATDQNKLRTALAKEQLYGAHGATRFGYKWGRKAHPLPKQNLATYSSESSSTRSYNWKRNFEVSTAAISNYVTSDSAKLSSSAEHTGYKWGIRSNADQAGYKWGIRSSADQAGYKWGIRSSADQAGYKWGIRSSADQAGYKWGIRSSADQAGYKWGIRSSADQAGYKWGIRSSADQAGYKWGIRSSADQAGYKWGIR